MLIDARRLEDGTCVEADLCLIGGGAVGIAMAMEFLGSSRRILLVEGGGLKPEPACQELYRGETSGLPYFPLEESRCRLFGGSTYRWGARGAPLNPIDFRRREWVPGSGWPISARELAPYYRRAEALAGMHSPFPYDERVFDLFALQPPAVDSARLRYQAFQFGRTLLFGEAYRRPLERARNVCVLLQAHATRLRASETEDHLEALDLRTLNGRLLTARAAAFVLCCGGIENARLLLLSGEGRSTGPCNEHDQVGRCFMEHPTVSAGTLSTSSAHRLLDVFTPGRLAGRLVEAGLALSEEVQQARGCLNAVAAVRPEAGEDATQALREIVWDLAHRRVRPGILRRLGYVASDPVGLVRNTYRHLRGRPKRFRFRSLYLELRIEQEPNPDSRVTLGATTDPFGLPVAHLHWALSERDHVTMRVLAEVVDAELRRLGLGAVVIDEWLRLGAPRFPDHMVGGHHHMGTTRMSGDETGGVVDGTCRTHAIDNLWIAGTSVFPTSGCVNPTPTALALALRLADHLKQRQESTGRASIRVRSARRAGRA
ncbi:MAG: GMC oxidoreductase [Gemmatimonadota bacterium]